MMTAAASLPARPDRSPFAGADVCRQAGLALPDQGSPPGLRRRPVGLHRRGRAAGPDVPGEPPLRLHRDRRPALAAGRQGADRWPCSPRATRRSRRCRGPTAPRFTCAAASDGWTSSSGSSSWLRRRGISEPGTDRHARTARHTWPTGATSSTRTAPSSASSSPGDPARAPPRSSSTWSTTGSCSPPTGSGRPAALGRGVRLGGRRDAVGGRTQNKTPPVADEVLQPMLAAALHLVTVLGPHAVELDQQVRRGRPRLVGHRPRELRHGAA